MGGIGVFCVDTAPTERSSALAELATEGVRAERGGGGVEGGWRGGGGRPLTCGIAVLLQLVWRRVELIARPVLLIPRPVAALALPTAVLRRLIVHRAQCHVVGEDSNVAPWGRVPVRVVIALLGALEAIPVAILVLARVDRLVSVVVEITIGDVQTCHDELARTRGVMRVKGTRARLTPSTTKGTASDTAGILEQTARVHVARVRIVRGASKRTHPCCARGSCTPGSTRTSRACHTWGPWPAARYRGCDRSSCHREGPDFHAVRCTCTASCGARRSWGTAQNFSQWALCRREGDGGMHERCMRRARTLGCTSHCSGKHRSRVD